VASCRNFVKIDIQKPKLNIQRQGTLVALVGIVDVERIT